MEPATSIIARLGGPTKVAEAVGVHRTRVSNWKRPKGAGGTDGRIPQNYHLRLLELARELGAALTPADFLPVDSASAPALSPHNDGAPITGGANARA